jgi:hypothetical protein
VIDVQRVDLKPFCIELEIKDKLLYFAFRSDEEVYGWMEDVYSRSPLMGVSQPTNFVHQVHVGFDPISGGFTVSLAHHTLHIHTYIHLLPFVWGCGMRAKVGFLGITTTME